MIASIAGGLELLYFCIPFFRLEVESAMPELVSDVAVCSLPTHWVVTAISKMIGPWPMYIALRFDSWVCS